MSGDHRNSGTTAGAPGVGRMPQAKLVLLGDTGVGKSSLALRFARGQFPTHCETTIGAAFLTQTVKVQGKNIKLDIWDTAGQERYHSLAPMYYRGAQAAIVVYDVNNANTFDRAVSWIDELRQQTTGNILIVLAGNKLDLASEHRAVQTEDARVFAEENGLIFAECSAKSGHAVNEMFMMIAQKMIAKQLNNTNPGQVRLNNEADSSGCRC
ncbi:unnamed protein product [Candidula unifasciata]|uniref:Uncharacterized protein n=1 Tax=Candidula unifasciata TaxID=100452 RepID=A0A8S3ZEI8_9EUPU|nr:unnamed protein product [Candidula unifasciata]